MNAMEGKFMRAILCLCLLTGTCQAAHPLVELLQNSPEVATVEQPLDAPRCIIHLRDWHWVPYEYVAAELPDDTPSDAVAGAYIDHLDQVREVQEEQFSLLKRLVDRDVKSVFREGLTPDIQPVYRTVSRALWKRHQRLNEVEEELYRTPNVLSLGVPGRLVARGLIKTVHAADTDATLALTDPLQPDGRLRRVSREAIEKREDHMVKQMLKISGSSIIVLGGAHDLSDNVKRLGEDRVGLIVVTTRGYLKHAEDE